MRPPRKIARSSLTQAAILAVVASHPSARPAQIARILEGEGYEVDLSTVSRHVQRLARGRYLTTEDGCRATDAGRAEVGRLRRLVAS